MSDETPDEIDDGEQPEGTWGNSAVGQGFGCLLACVGIAIVIAAIGYF